MEQKREADEGTGWERREFVWTVMALYFTARGVKRGKEVVEEEARPPFTEKGGEGIEKRGYLTLETSHSHFLASSMV